MTPSFNLPAFEISLSSPLKSQPLTSEPVPENPMRNGICVPFRSSFASQSPAIDCADAAGTSSNVAASSVVFMTCLLVYPRARDEEFAQPMRSLKHKSRLGGY